MQDGPHLMQERLPQVRRVKRPTTLRGDESKQAAHARAIRLARQLAGCASIISEFDIYIGKPQPS